MIIETYNKTGTGFERRKCQCCGRNRICCQHHIDGRRNSDDVIWVCSNGGSVFYVDACHQKIHNPTSFGLPSSWAYDNGYLRRLDSRYKKKKSSSRKWKINK